MERIYKFNNSQIRVLFDDIINSNADIIVSSISMTGGVSSMIRRKVSASIFTDIKKFVPTTLGDVIVTTAGDLQNKYIFHIVTIERKRLLLLNNNGNNKVTPSLRNIMIEKSINKCFRLMNALDLTSIAFPAIGAGAAHLPIEEIASNMIRTIATNLTRTNKSINVELYLYIHHRNMSEWDFLPFFEKIGKYLPDDAFNNNITVEAPSVQEEALTDSPSVFISYSRKDIDKSKKICETLKDNGINYWIDEEGKYSGSNFKGVLVEQIRKSSVVLFLSSENSNQSKNVIKEIGVAVHYSIPIIPIKLDNTSYDVNIEYDLCNIDYIEYKQNDSFNNKMLDSIRVYFEDIYNQNPNKNDLYG